MTRGPLHRLAVIAVVVLAAGWLGLAAGASDDSFNGAHWARKKRSFTLQLGDNVDNRWDRHLKRAARAWSKSSVLNAKIVDGRTKPKKCRPTNGRVEVCSARHGKTGWLGMTRVWVDGGNHIVKAAVLLNDSYFNGGKYDDRDAMRHTACHEVGHAFGQDHVRTRSCLNDSEAAIFRNVKPIKKDYRTLEKLYRHRDRETTVGQAAVDGSFFDPAATPPLTPRGARGDETVLVEDLGGGGRLITFITWLP